MAQEYLQPVGSSVAAAEPAAHPRAPRLTHPSSWRLPTWRLTALSSLDVGVLVLVALACAAAGGTRMDESLIHGGNVDVAAMLRAAVALALAVGGITLQLSPERRRIGRVLLAAAIVPCLSLVNGSQHYVAFSIGSLALSLTPALLSLLMLAAPLGRLDSPLERRFIELGVCATLLVGLAISIDPDHAALSWLMRGTAIAIPAGTAVLIVRRASSANSRVRALLGPMAMLAVLYATVTVACVVLATLGSLQTARYGFEIANVLTALVIPVAILLGLGIERISLGRVLAGFVSNLGLDPASDVQAAMAATLNDPYLHIYYRSGESDEFLDAEGRRPLPSPASSRRRALAQGGGHSAAVVDYDANLFGQEEFLRAAAATALLWVEQERLVTDLAAAKTSLEASRLRLSRAADEERRKIQRDLHDGAQQHLIGMHLKLGLALEALEGEPARSAELLAEVGEEMKETARDLRSLATNVFPVTLREHGLVGALASAIRTMGLSVRLETSSVDRHPPDVEMQVYFVCLEGLQNIAKHGGADVAATLRMWAVPRWLFFELRDTGPGFDREEPGNGYGLENMNDRLASVGGRLSVVSEPGEGTILKGMVPDRHDHPRSC